MTESLPLALVLRITGRVQGVGFRAWTDQQARARGLSGWVRNEADGAVSALVHGPGPAVRDMVAACRLGPPGARVEAVETSPAVPPAGAGFSIRF